MFPIWDDQVKWWYIPIFTWLIIAINVIVFIYQLWLSDAWLDVFFTTYSTIPVKIMSWEQRYSLITSMFLHGWWMHIIGNMLFLYVFGDNIEARMGNIRFLIFYLLSGLVGSFAHVLTDTTSIVPSLWASWAISWVLWAYLVMFPGSRVKMRDPRLAGTYYVSASQFLLYWIVIQLFSGFGSLAMTWWWGGWWTAWFAHIWWFAVGWIRGLMNKQRYWLEWQQLLDSHRSPLVQ